MNETNADKLKRRNAELAILNSIAQALNRSVDLDEAVQTALAQVADLLDLYTGWVWLLRENGDSYLAAAQNLPPALAHRPDKMAGTCYCLDTFRAGDLAGAANVNVVTCSRLKGLIDGTDGLRYHASIPLYAHGRKMGVLNVASRDWRQLSAEDLQLLYTVGDMLGIAVERAHLFTQQAALGALEERNRLAREIHDTLAQGLTAVSLQLESADALLEADAAPAKVRQVVQHALALTRANLEEARRSVLDLRAAPLEGRTLVEALAALAEQTAVPVDLLVQGGVRPLPRRLETGLYRLAQEALQNVSRHAQARRAVVELAFRPAEIRLTVADDGVGFDPTAVPPDRFGLIGMNERVRLLNGRLHLQSAPGEGTHIEVVLPG
ncbi:MAG: GAF domain-containing sensor histidine kinase [Chloroflexi bacterium]|nr:GAF domain-containing sensor histidine kinase [Ardenticatenaceae bacterium]NOG33510.1 GAF domain-containing sensor histidine kinase [Chloroflexota bacterium]GIK55795.1 MAG: sensor histidine kinase [Chloroflexota bacterium]